MDVVVGTELEDLLEVDSGTELKVGIVGGDSDFTAHLGFAMGLEVGVEKG